MADRPQTAEEIEQALADLPDVDVDIVEDYPFDGNELDGDQKLKCFLVDGFVQADYEGRVMVETLDMLFNWIKTGALPSKPKDKTHLREITKT